MNYVGRNIKFLRKRNGLTQDDLARKMGVTRYKIGSYEEGRALPKLDLLQFIADYFNHNLDDLVNTDLANNEETADPDNQLSKQANLRVLTTVVNSANEERFVIVPQKASAGYTRGYGDPDFIEKLPVFDLPLPEFRNNSTYRVFQINGDSMEPIPSGSYIICEYIENPGEIRYGESHILVTKNEGIIYKRIEGANGNEQKIVLKSDNPEYKSYTINKTEILEVWKAVGFITSQLPDARDVSQSKIQHLIADLKNELERFRDEE